MSFDDPRPEFVVGSSTQPPAYKQPIPAPAQLSRVTATSPHPPSPVSPHLAQDERGRKNKRTSLGMLFEAVKDRVRSVSRAERDTPPHSLTRDGSVERTESSLTRRSESSLGRRGRTREPREKTTLERVTEVLGLEAEENEVGESWKEFRKGADRKSVV